MKLIDKSFDLLALQVGDVVTKRNLFDLIQFSKVKGSTYWSGSEYLIGNTPQQGINWIGHLGNIRAVVVKTRIGSYVDDGYQFGRKELYNYSFKAQRGQINYEETANRVLIEQVLYGYPILLFEEDNNTWRFEGNFFVEAVEDRYVTLKRGQSDQMIYSTEYSEESFTEGSRRLATNLLIERNRAPVRELKKSQDWICDICEVRNEDRYGLSFIEAHHKTPVSSFEAKHQVKMSETADLLYLHCYRSRACPPYASPETVP